MGGCPPINSVYVQYPQQKSPQEIWFLTQWIELNYDGAFFRSSGGYANAFIENGDTLIKQSEGIPNITGGFGDLDRWRNKQYGAFYYNSTLLNSDAKSGDAGNIQTCGFSASLGETKLDGTLKNDVYGKSDHVTPENYTINVWKRIA